MKQLAPPPDAKRDPASQEMVRAWVVKQGLQCSLNVGVFGENEAVMWGILLSDIARHVANALQDSKGVAADDTLRSIANSFNFEMQTPTAEVRGEFRKQ